MIRPTWPPLQGFEDDDVRWQPNGTLVRTTSKNGGRSELGRNRKSGEWDGNFKQCGGVFSIMCASFVLRGMTLDKMP